MYLTKVASAKIGVLNSSEIARLAECLAPTYAQLTLQPPKQLQIETQHLRIYLAVSGSYVIMRSPC